MGILAVLVRFDTLLQPTTQPLIQVLVDNRRALLLVLVLVLVEKQINAL